jgi:tRNA acetyltransferase TAN1
MYGIEPPTNDKDAAEDDAELDIEASIEAELSRMKSSEKPQGKQTFTPVSSGIECLFFMKTTEPVEPVALAKRICEDARDCQDPRQRKCKYINRLTPVVNTDKATENGIAKVAASVLAPWFALNNEVEGDTEKAEEEPPSAAASAQTTQYTVRVDLPSLTTRVDVPELTGSNLASVRHSS